jgi:tetratricopeptide (TPR) repeat protein
MALDMTLQARRMAFHAIDLARGRGGPGPDPGPGPIDLEPRAQHAIERAGDHLERARECVGTPMPPVAQRILDLAAARLDEARQAFRDRRFSLALDIATQIDRMLGDVCRGNRGEDLDHLYDNVEQLIERAAPIINESHNPTALGMLDQAHNLVQRGREAMASNNTVLARESLRTARDLLLQALRLADHMPDANNVDRLLEDTANDLAKLGEQIQAAGHPEATVLFQRALEHLERARALRSRDDLRPTLAELRVARNLAWRAARLAGVRGF